MTEATLIDCIKLQKRKIKIISLVLAISLFVNLILAVMLCTRLTHKAADVKQTTAATACADCSNYDIYEINTDIIRGRLPWNQTILEENTRYKICKNSSLKRLSHNLCSAKLKKPYCLISTLKNYLCGKSAISTVIPKAV
ncbi:MAG: hypothetical protein U0K91_11040 [Acutalibacteraceae bacterium]|nr:hypothetical protein [Acutalibacteraceae bacterium]